MAQVVPETHEKSIRLKDARVRRSGVDVCLQHTDTVHCLRFALAVIRHSRLTWSILVSMLEL